MFKGFLQLRLLIHRGDQKLITGKGFGRKRIVEFRVNCGTELVHWHDVISRQGVSGFGRGAGREEKKAQGQGQK